jgi:hypothetical protein
MKAARWLDETGLVRPGSPYLDEPESTDAA